MKKIFLLFTALIFGINFSGKACSPLQVPTLTSFNMTGPNLNLFWTSNTTYACTYSIQVEIACLGNAFSGTGSPPFYISPSISKPSAAPFAYPVQTINTSTLCAGSVYSFRAREVYGGFTFSGWTSTFTFTTPGTYVPPTLTLSASPVTVCPPQTSQLTASVINGCGAPTPYSYTWTPAAGLSCTNCANPVASPTVSTTYTCSVKGGQLGCWNISNTITVGLGSLPTITLTTAQPSCTNAIASSTALVGGGATASGYTVTWNPTPGTVTPIPNGSSAAGLSFGATSVTCTDANGCKSTSTLNIVPVPVFSYSVNSANNSFTLFCAPSTVTLNAVNTSTLSNPTYTWNPGNFTGSSFNVTTPGVYTVTGQDIVAGTCPVTQTVSISQNTTVPVVNVTPTTANLNCNGVCPTFTATTSPTLNLQGSWYDISNNPIGALSNSPLLLTACAPGVYVATFTNITNGCVGSNSVTLTANNTIPTMTINALNGYTITCLQPCLVFNITSSATLAPKGYTWTNMATSASVTPITGGYTVCTPGNYLAQFHDGNFCTVSQMITVSIDTVRPSPSCITGLASNGFTLNCFNSCITPTAISNPLLPISNYSWTVPPNLTVSSNTVPICLANITSSTTPTNFTVLAAGANGCVGRAKIPFYKDIFVPAYTAVFTPSAITCASSSVAMSPNNVVATSTTPVSFTFTSPPPTTTATVAGALFGIPGPYTMTYVNQLNGCSNTAYTVVPINATPPATVALGQATIPCGSNTVLITAGTTSNLASYQYSWVGPVGSGITNPSGYSTSVNSDGSYVVTITNTVNGCVSTNTVDVVLGNLTVGFTPSPQQGFAPLTVNFTNTTVLGSSTTGTVSTLWGYGNGSTYTVTNLSSGGTPNGSAQYPTAGSYTVLLAVTQSVTVAGHTTFCAGTATTVIIVDLPSKLDIPNVFTPNADGINDVFMLQTTNLTDITCVIFDRWGVKMYDVTSQTGNIAWDGKTLFGKDAPAGTYFYIITATGKDTQTFEQKGVVSLYR